jgi:hypothetical protein
MAGGLTVLFATTMILERKRKSKNLVCVVRTQEELENTGGRKKSRKASKLLAKRPFVSSFVEAGTG